MRESGEMAVPHFFRCPISLELLEDPVTLCTGQTYDRSSIEKWLAAGNLTCPVTMQKLHDPSMVPNHTLRNLIDQWLQLRPQFDPGYSEEMDSLATIKHQLQSHSTTLDQKLKLIEKLNLLLDESYPPRNSCFVQLGFLSLLLEIAFGRFEAAEISKHHVQFIELALSCIVKLLPLSNLQILNTLKEESKLASFSQLFEQGTVTMKISLCLLMDALSSSETKELCGLLGNSQRLLHQIVLLVPQNSEASKAGVKALAALCSSESNTENLVKAGTVDAIITCIASSERLVAKNLTVLPLAMQVMEKLLEHESAKEALVCNPKGVHALVKMVFRVSDHEWSESAVESLLLVCHDSCRAREEAIGGGVLTQLLLLLQSQCSARTKAKARILLKMLRSKWGEDTR